MRTTLVGLLLALPFAACNSNRSDQVLSGRVAAGFPQAITGVQVLRGAAVVASSSVAGDGSFELHVPPGSGLSLELVSAGGHDTIVFPRMTGTIDRTFATRPGGPEFDLGLIRFVGDSSMTQFSFHGLDSGSDCDGGGHDGMGAMCCDDGGGGSDDGGTCGSDTGSGAVGSGSGAGPVIPFTAPDDGGGDDGSDDGSGSGGGGHDNGDGVCEHNFPDNGCAGEGNGGDGDGSGEHGGGQEADLPYDVKPQLGTTATPILDAFAAKGSGLPTAITNVTMDAPSWRLAELKASTPFVIDATDCSHIGNTGSVGRDRVFVTWTNSDGSTSIDHLDIEYCQQ